MTNEEREQQQQQTEAMYTLQGQGRALAMRKKLATKNLMILTALVERDWAYIQAHWHTTGGFHGLSTIHSDDRQWMKDEAAKDGVTLT